MKIINIEPNLSDDERKHKLEEASRLFMRIYEQHEKNKQTTIKTTQKKASNS